MKRNSIILTAILVVAMQDALFAQHSLQINNGSGVYGIIALPPGGTPGIYNYVLPQGGGTIVVDPGPGFPSSGWLTAGNTLVGGEKLGSLNNFDVSLVANDMEILRLICTTGVNLNTNMELRMDGDPGTSGYILQSNGPGANPTWVLNPGFAASDEPFLTFAADGGTLSDNRVLTAGTGIDVTITPGDNNAATISNTGVLSITGTANQVLPVGPSTGNVTLSLPQDIHTGATPTFAQLTTTGNVLVGGDLILTGGASSDIFNNTANPVIISDLQGLQVNALGTGVVHSNGAGLLSSSAVVSADIQDLTIATIDIANDAVTLAKIQNAVNSSRVLGSGAAGAGSDYAELTLGANLAITGTSLNTVASPSFTSLTTTGDVNVGGDLILTGGATSDIFNNTANPVIISDLQGLQVNALGTGVVHSNGAGLLSSSAVVSADIQDLTIATIDIANDAVTLAKIQNAVNSSRVLGSGAAGAGSDYAELTLGANLAITGTSLNTVASPSFTSLTTTGDVNVGGDLILTGGASSDIFNNTANPVIISDLQGLQVNALGTGVVHSNGAGLLSSSLIVNTDVSATAGIAFSKLANMSANSRLLGSGSAGAGSPPTEINLGAGLAMTGTTLSTTGLAPSNADYLVLTNNASLSNERAFTHDLSLRHTDNGADADYVLGIDLTNGNSWSGDQLLPATDAQGTNLITAVNSSTTGTINDARIDGAIARDNESPAAGDVTGSLSTGYLVNSVQTAAGTSIVAAINSVADLINGDNINIDASLQVSANKLGINLGNANTWTATQSFPATSAQGDALIASVNAGSSYITEGRIDASSGTEGQVLTVSSGIATWQPSAQSLVYGVVAGAGAPYASNQNDLDLLTGNDNATLFDLSSTTDIDITGIVAGSSGRTIILYNSGSNEITLKHLDVSSTAANQFEFYGSDTIMGPGSIVTVVYVNSKWRLISYN